MVFCCCCCCTWVLQHMVNTVIVCFAQYIYILLLFPTKQERMSESGCSCCAPFFSQRVSVITGSSVRPTLGWYVLCLCPVLPHWAYGCRFTRVLSPLPTNGAEANTLVFNLSHILMRGFVLTGFMDILLWDLRTALASVEVRQFRLSDLWTCL